MKVPKDTMKMQKVKVLVPARNPAKLANSMGCCKPGSPAAVRPVEE